MVKKRRTFIMRGSAGRRSHEHQKTVDYSKMYRELTTIPAKNLPQMIEIHAIGKVISQRPEKGAAVAAAEFLQTNFPDRAGFSPRNVRRMRDFYRTYENDQTLLRLAMKIGWTQNVVIMEVELTREARKWYLEQARAQQWSKVVLLEKLASAAHLEKSLDESKQDWYTKENDECSERMQHEEDPVYLPRQYPKKPRKSLLYQRFSSLKRRVLHHNYTICERALM